MKRMMILTVFAALLALGTVSAALASGPPTATCDPETDLLKVVHDGETLIQIKVDEGCDPISEVVDPGRK